MGAPFFIVFAGVNGAGKTTFFHSGLQPRNDPERTRSLEESGAGSRFGISHLHVLHWR